MDNLLTRTCCSVDSNKKKNHRRLRRGTSFSETFCFGREEKGTGLMTLDFWSNLCCLCSPRNTCIPIFVYSAAKERLIKCRRVSFELWKEQVLLWASFSTSSSYLRILALGILFSGLRPLKLFLTCSTYFWNDIHIVALLHPHPPRISPPDTTFWSISCRAQKGPRKLPVNAPTTRSGRLISLPPFGNKGKPLTFQVPQRLLCKIYISLSKV